LDAELILSDIYGFFGLMTAVCEPMVGTIASDDEALREAVVVMVVGLPT